MGRGIITKQEFADGLKTEIDSKLDSNDLAELSVASSYSHTQAVSLSSWTINHALNKYPSVTVIDTANTVIIGAVEYNDSNNLTITFTSPFSGEAYMV